MDERARDSEAMVGEVREQTEGQEEKIES